MSLIQKNLSQQRPRHICICGVPEDFHDSVPRHKCPGYQERYSMDVHSICPEHDNMLVMETLQWDSQRRWYHRLLNRFQGKVYCFWCQCGQPIEILSVNPFNRKGPDLYVSVRCKVCNNVVGPIATSFLLDIFKHIAETKGEYRAALVAKKFMLMAGVQLRD